MSPDARDTRIVVSGHESLDPVGSGDTVIIEEGDDAAAGDGDAGVTRH
jgi:hypothetical protein